MAYPGETEGEINNKIPVNSLEGSRNKNDWSAYFTEPNLNKYPAWVGLQVAFLLYRDWLNCLTERGDLMSRTWMTVATCWEKMSNSLISAGMPGPSSRWANRASLKGKTEIPIGQSCYENYCSRQMSSHTDGAASGAKLGEHLSDTQCATVFFWFSFTC